MGIFLGPGFRPQSRRGLCCPGNNLFNVLILTGRSRWVWQGLTRPLDPVLDLREPSAGGARTQPILEVYCDAVRKRQLATSGVDLCGLRSRWRSHCTPLCPRSPHTCECDQRAQALGVGEAQETIETIRRSHLVKMKRLPKPWYFLYLRLVHSASFVTSGVAPTWLCRDCA